MRITLTRLNLIYIKPVFDKEVKEMQKITVHPDDVWSYFQKHKVEIEKEQHTIAENEEYGVVIYLSAEKEFPCLIVTADGYQYEEQTVSSQSECAKSADKLYEKYLTSKFLISGSYTMEKSEDSLLNQKDKIEERELELDDLVLLVLDTVLEEDASALLGSDIDDICDDVKDHLLEYLYRKHDISVRRPMILEDSDTGEDFFSEYPYECMEFDDEDNPIYK